MPYKRVYIPELGEWKIIGELTGEEALALSATIPQGMTQWGWNARTGTFAYGTQYNSQLQTFATIPVNVRDYLVQFPKDVPYDPTGPYLSNVTGTMLAVGLGILIGLPLLLSKTRRRKNGKVKKRK